ncbi:MAG: substrate-binding domain-containing protein [Candidatus Methylacidiphilales bacterium]|nr:LacI family DNA-binding transcriptional regulator [Candidatus Methylacidiphilales bacterium]
MEKKRVTVRDVAKIADVHFTTVSRALIKHPSIPISTCERIRKIADDLGYVPDPMLSALTAYRTNLRSPTFHGTLAWLNNSFSRNGWNTCTTFELYRKGAATRAQELGYRLDDFWLREPGMTSRRAVEIFAARNIRGLIVPPQPRAKMRLRFDWERFAAVSFGFTLAWPALHRVTINAFHAMQTTVRHLRAMGYRRPGLVVTANTDARINRAWSGGFLSLQSDWPAVQRLPVHMPRTMCDEGFLKWLRATEPDVVISQEFHLLEVLEQNGYSIPRDIGFATQTLTSYEHTRKICGIDENAEQTGAAAVNLLVGMIHRSEWGIPLMMQSLLIEGTWRDGDTLKRQAA